MISLSCKHTCLYNNVSEVNKMTKTDLIEFIAENADLTKADSARAIDALIEGIKKRR